MNAQPNGSPILLALGDSVMWGQGLQDWNKFYRIVWYALSSRPEYAGLVPILKAHSGAIIGAGEEYTERQAPGEVPWQLPSIIQQCASFDGNPDSVKVVLVNGGINDVTVQAIVDPNTTPDHLSSLITGACHDGMVQLLRDVTRKFANPSCKIIVPGYYQILGSASSIEPTAAFLELLGISVAAELVSSLAGFSDIVSLSAQFRREADAALAKAVDDANAEDQRKRITFVSSGFSESNALFLPESLLWGIKGVPPFVNAEDDFATYRSQVCSNFYLDGSVGCAICRFGSVAHPTASGALKYSNAILAALAQ